MYIHIYIYVYIYNMYIYIYQFTNLNSSSIKENFPSINHDFQGDNSEVVISPRHGGNVVNTIWLVV